jgi:hypothetical protein
VFCVAALIWIAGLVGSLRKVRETKNEAVRTKHLAKGWAPIELPERFQKISRNTTIAEAKTLLGPYKRSRGFNETLALEYQHGEGAVLLFPEIPLTSESRIVGVVYFRDRKDILFD